jgi:hypothetical protein
VLSPARIAIDAAFVDQSRSDRGVDSHAKRIFANRRVTRQSYRPSCDAYNLSRPEFAEGGGLINYAPSIPDQLRQVGIYVGRILKGATG